MAAAGDALVELQVPAGHMIVYRGLAKALVEGRGWIKLGTLLMLVVQEKYSGRLI